MKNPNPLSSIMLLLKHRHFVLAALLGMIMALSGCGTLIPLPPVLDPGAPFKADQDLMQQRMKITTKFQSNPDTDAWYEQRQKIGLATGDRVFDKDFARVFDSLVLAVSSLELKVNNMERESGIISASGITLPPTESKAMRREAVNDWCTQNGFDPSILTREFRTQQYQQMGGMTDVGEMMAKYEKMMKGLTFQLIKMGDKQTKVKLRFSDVYYPAEVETYYKLMWQAVDKQIFVDKNIEGAVEQRK